MKKYSVKNQPPMLTKSQLSKNLKLSLTNSNHREA